MVERIEEPEAQVATDIGAEPLGAAAAMVVGLRKGRVRDRPDPRLDAFLDEQTDLIRIQKEHLHEQRELVLSRLRWGRFSDRVKAALQVMTALVGVAVAVVIGAMAWHAHEDHGVRIEAFSVAPDLVGRGLTGQVVASKLLDKLADLQAKTVTTRPASSYADDWGGDIKVEIPETGVSIGELYRYLREWLGSETRISGEVVRTPAGLAVTARAGLNAGKTFEGPDADFDKLMQDAAEDIYAKTQAYRWAVYLATSGRRAEALQAYQNLVESGDPADRAWADTGWATILAQEGRFREASRLAQDAIRVNPRLVPAYSVLSNAQYFISHDEASADLSRREIALMESGRAVGISGTTFEDRLSFSRGVQAYMVGDFGRAAILNPGAAFIYEGRPRAGANATTWVLVRALTGNHDVTAARRLPSNPLFSAPINSTGGPEAVAAQQAIMLDDWGSLVPLAERMFDSGIGDARMSDLAALVAVAHARVGRLAEAEALLSQTPLDCYDCLQARGLAAGLKRDWAQADRWYAEAARQAPSIPFAQTAWGQSLLDRGDPDGAIARFKDAHRITPHFPDAVELWGEALMRKGDLEGAAAKFAETDQYAPRWGRNHLRWGEALMLSGRYAEARAQYQAANGMDLSKSDRAALDVLLARTAGGPLHG
jgi:tetratricopeptide (TPR) repeat protein